MQETSTRVARQRAPRERNATTDERGGGPAQMGNALEAFRVAATLFVAFYHAGLAYLATPMRLTLWLVYDPAHSPIYDGFVYWVNGWVMPLFFLAAGVSAPAACEARGPLVFLTARARRLLKPMLFGGLTILPLTYMLWGYGLIVSDRCDLSNIVAWRFSPAVSEHLYGLGHFWFLEYLYLVCVVWCAGWMLRRFLSRRAAATTGEGWVQRLCSSPWKPILFAVPTALIFCIDSDTMLRVNNALVPNPLRLLHYTYFFAVGGWISKIKDPKARFIPHSNLYLVLAIAVYGVLCPLLLRHAAAPVGGWARYAVSLGSALFTWLLLFGGLGVLMRVVQARNTCLRYLSESSFWVYIIHVPFIALMHIMLLPLPWPSVVKFLLVATVALGISLLSYEYIVRRSLIGEIINGTRKRSKSSWKYASELGWVVSVLVVACGLAVGLWSIRGGLGGANVGVVSAGQVFRSARLTPPELDDLIRRHGLRSVVTFTSSGKHNWFLEQQRVCDERRITLNAIKLDGDQLPTRPELDELVALLESSPRPLLIQGNRGFKRTALASALVRLLAGASPREALQEFSLKYGDIGGPQHSVLAAVVLAYQHELERNGRQHSPEHFRAWVQSDYLVNSCPAVPGDPRIRPHALADAARGATVVK